MSPLERLADLAPTLKEAELRVLLYLSARAIAAGEKGVRASSREIAANAKVARSSTVQALDALANRLLIATRQGSATQAAGYYLTCLETVQIAPQTVRARGPVAGPPPDLTGPNAGPPLDLFPDHPGPFAGPPPHAEPTTSAKSRRVDIDGSLTLAGIFDRLASSKVSHFHPDIFAAARRFLHGYLAKLGTREILANGVPHPPDDKVVTQFLTLGQGMGEWPRLEAMLYELMSERKEAYSYGWFLTVALQRIHGIQPEAVKEHRAKLRGIKLHGRAHADPELQKLDEGLMRASLLKRIV
jgi:hypothetical protein